MWVDVGIRIDVTPTALRQACDHVQHLLIVASQQLFIRRGPGFERSEFTSEVPFLQHFIDRFQALRSLGMIVSAVLVKQGMGEEREVHARSWPVFR